MTTAAIFKQAERLLIINTPLGKDKLLLYGFAGTEALSSLFHFELDLFSPDDDIEPDQLIGKNVTFGLRLPDKTDHRWFNGYVSRFRKVETRDRITRFRAELVPWTWFLTRSTDCRTFVNKTVPQIVDDVFKDFGFEDYEFRLSGQYTPREYTVQYRETAFNFVSRLLEQEGIFYFYRHENGKHVMVIGDAPNVHPAVEPLAKVPYARGTGIEDAVTEWRHSHEMRAGKYAFNDYNFTTPNANLLTGTDTLFQMGGNEVFELFDYPGHYATRKEGEKLVDIRMEQEEVAHSTVQGGGRARTLASGFKFELADHPNALANGWYVVTSVSHQAEEAETFSGGKAAGEVYKNRFQCIPAQVVFRPPMVTPRPTVRGCQTAVVSGPAGEEIWTDKFGRVRLHFHRDRRSKRDENSSTWVRVAQTVAGKGWGAFSVPRIGQEVVVDFLEGDPDRPIIVGRVYNADQHVPYELPAEQAKTGLKTHSTKGGGGFNEIRLDDRKGDEQVFVHAEKNMDVRVKNDAFATVGRNAHAHVLRDGHEQVDNDRHEAVGRDHVEEIARDRHLHVKGKEAVKVDGTLSLKVGGDVVEVFDSNHSQQVTADHYLKARNIVIEADVNITIKVGQIHIVLTPEGIKLGAPTGKIKTQTGPMGTEMESTGPMSLKATPLKLN